MLFKNAMAYRVTPGFRFDPELLRRRTARECGPTESQTDGFTEPCAHSTAGLVHHVAGAQLICWQTEDKLLPGSVVEEETTAKCEAIAEEQGYKPGKKQRKTIKEQVTLELLPKAFVQKKRTYALLTPEYFIIDTSSPARADALIESLRFAIDAVPFRLLATAASPTGTMSAWIISEDPPELLTLDDEALLEKPVEEKPVVHYTRTDLGDSDVRHRVEAGYLPKKVGMTYDGKIAFVVTSKMQVCRLRWLDLLAQAERQEQAKDADDMFDSDMAIVAGDVSRLLNYLVEQFGGWAPDEEDLASGGVAAAAKKLDSTLREDGATATLMDGDGKAIATFGDGPDPLYEEAKRIVIAGGKASISFVQRSLMIGYNRAARLVEQMEKDGIVSPMAADGARKVMVTA